MSVYKKAARLIVENKAAYACDAIRHSKKQNTLELFKFEHYFRPKILLGLEGMHLWWGDNYPENQMARSIALLLMHEIQKHE